MLHVTSTPDDAAVFKATGDRLDGIVLPERLAISSIFGLPTDRRTWSGAPSRIATALEKLGVEIVDVFPRVTEAEKWLFATRYMLSGYGRIPTSLSLFRGLGVRRLRARRVAETMKKRKASDVLHTGTLDLPADDTEDVNHYLYCDHTWDLWLRHRSAEDPHTTKACAEFDDLDRACYEQMRHIFTFGGYVRENLISHYGIAPEKVTAVGSGMGWIDPYFGPKTYGNGKLLFVAKHYFALKGGELVLDAFRIAKRIRSGLGLAVVWDGADAGLLRRFPDVEFHSNLSWNALARLYREAALFVQPMLNDPWGQVYLEALASRTPVLGLNRNGLPEISAQGRHGFLVDEATPEALAQAILDAMSDPGRLGRMGVSGQRHVLQNYSWDGVVRRMASIIGSSKPAIVGIGYAQ